jgi:predicted phage terminase large subunit-like protein
MDYEGRGLWQREPHLELLCEKLEMVARGQIRRLMIFMPPRHGKSQVVSKKFPAWYLGNWPGKSIILACYAAELAFDFSQIARDTLEAEREIFPNVRVNRMSRAKARWTLEGYYESGMIAAGVGGPITGRGADIGIIDDPIKNAEEAQSETVRESVWQWYRTTFRTRLQPGGSIILIMTRWHEDDLAGRLLENMKAGGEQWEVISLPAIAEEDDLLGRKPGEPLSPRYPLSELLPIKQSDRQTWISLYQQRPRPEDGSYFHTKWFVNIDLHDLRTSYLNRLSQPLVYSAMDFAIGEKDQNNWNVITTGALTTGNELIITDVQRFRADSFETSSYDIAERILDVQKEFQPLLFGFEDGQIFKAIWPVVLRLAKERGIVINEYPLTPIRDKQARARILQARMRKGQVLFPHEALWFENLQEELLAFPNGKWDDQVDALAWLAIMVNEIDPNEWSGMAV